MIYSVTVSEMRSLVIPGPEIPLEVRRWNMYYSGADGGGEYRYQDALPCATVSLRLSTNPFVLCETLFRALSNLEIGEPDQRYVVRQFMWLWRTARDILMVPVCVEVRVVSEGGAGEGPVRMGAIQRAMRGLVPASNAAIRALRSPLVRSGGMSCPVCFEELQVGSGATEMPCTHLFHWRCISEWLQISHYCPVCRHEMPTA